jgi:hypothetical protein
MFDVVCRVLYVLCCVLVVGCWVLVFGCSMLDVGCWMLDAVYVVCGLLNYVIPLTADRRL